MTETKPEKQTDHYWRNYMIAWGLLTLLSLSSANNLLTFALATYIVNLGTIVLVLEYVHKRYLNEIKEIIKSVKGD